jgi:hypothetical protein
MSEAAVVITPSKVADYQCNSAMAISQVGLCYMTENNDKAVFSLFKSLKGFESQRSKG